MRRSDREITGHKEIMEIIGRCDVCRLALNDDVEGIPYILPLNFGYEEDADGCVTLYFHGATEGYKYDVIARDPRAAFEMDCDHRLASNRERGYCTMEYSSVIGRGKIEIITDREQMENIFSTYRPDYVFHAAAYKHVPMMEDNPAIAVQNNVYGTRVIADLAVKYGTGKFVMISTDKAVNPTNVMGCSKRICEIYCQSLNQAIQEGKVRGVTQFVTTRFGNVLGSNGSVIPIFKAQIRNGGPITVTHPDIIRYFMLIPEACKLVLEAGTMGKGGEIFVFDMGQPVRIVDLAKRMIALSGAKNIEIRFTGLRNGEKLYEEVLNDKEATLPTSNPKIMVAKVREYDYATACANEEKLMEVSGTFDDMAIVRVMKEIVPEYKSRHSKYDVLD